MQQGTIVKALSGFYYVSTDGEPIACRARGKFRKEGMSPMVGDVVNIDVDNGTGTVKEILPRKNAFVRPAVANIDLLVIIAAAVIPVTDPYLIDRVVAMAEHCDCDSLICINKADLHPGDALYETYRAAGFQTIRTSAVSGEGIAALRAAIDGKTCAFTGNSGVGKSSILNAIAPQFGIQVGEVSEKLGRGRHTTRHVELFDLGNRTFIADTPGFSSFDNEKTEPIRCEELQYAFREFRPYLGQCRFRDCAHLKEPGCAVLAALAAGDIAQSRHDSYARLYDLASKVKEWELK